jgi:hypothetical protein
VPGSLSQFASQRFGRDDIAGFGQLSGMPALGAFIVTAIDEGEPQGRMLYGHVGTVSPGASILGRIQTSATRSIAPDSVPFTRMTLLLVVRRTDGRVMR